MELRGACRSPQDPAAPYRIPEKPERAPSSLQELAGAPWGSKKRAGAHRILQDPTGAQRTPQEPPGARLTPGCALSIFD